jgi:hypothetical protein
VNRSAEIMRPPESISFEMIPIGEVPFRWPKAKLAANPSGSRWDKVLAALEQQENGRIAVKIVEANATKRNKLKSTLQTMAKNRGFAVGLFNEGSAFYAWISHRAGRYSPPPK